MAARAIILNLTLTFYLNKESFSKYGGLERYLNLNLTCYLNKVYILQYGG